MGCKYDNYCIMTRNLLIQVLIFRMHAIFHLWYPLMSECTCVCVRVGVCMYMSIRMHANVCACMSVHVCVFMFMCVRVRVCVNQRITSHRSSLPLSCALNLGGDYLYLIVGRRNRNVLFASSEHSG